MCDFFLQKTAAKFVDREEGGGNRQTFKHFNNKINKHKSKAAAPHGRLLPTKHKIKSRTGPLSSSTFVGPPRSIPTALDPAHSSQTVDFN